MLFFVRTSDFRSGITSFLFLRGMTTLRNMHHIKLELPKKFESLLLTLEFISRAGKKTLESKEYCYRNKQVEVWFNHKTLRQSFVFNACICACRMD